MSSLRLRPAALALAGFVLPAVAVCAPMPVQVERFQGEVVQMTGAGQRAIEPRRAVDPGTLLRTGADGHAELRLHGAATLSLGGRTELLLHSMDQRVLRLRMAAGALRVDTRGQAGVAARDVRLNVGDLRLRVANAEALAELGDRGAQVCLIAGTVEAQQPTSTARLDAPGQCLRQSGASAQWSMVPVEVLRARVAPPAVPSRLAVAPTAPPAPPPVVIDAVAPASPPPVETLPTAPAAAATVAVVPAAALEAPPVPPPPEPLPLVPPVTGTVAIMAPQPVEPVTVPPVPEPPAAASPNVAEAPGPGPGNEASSAPSPAASGESAAPAAEAPDARELAWRRDLVAELMVREGRMPPPAAPTPPPATVDEVAVATPAAAMPPSAADDGRRWRVVLGSMPERDKAEREVERLAARGWAVEAREYRVGDRHGFRIGFGEFPTREQAQSALDEFLEQYPDAAAWLAKY